MLEELKNTDHLIFSVAACVGLDQYECHHASFKEQAPEPAAEGRC